MAGAEASRTGPSTGQAGKLKNARSGTIRNMTHLQSTFMTWQGGEAWKLRTPAVLALVRSTSESVHMSVNAARRSAYATM